MRVFIPIAGLLCSGTVFAQDHGISPGPLPPGVEPAIPVVTTGNQDLTPGALPPGVGAAVPRRIVRNTSTTPQPLRSDDGVGTATDKVILWDNGDTDGSNGYSNIRPDCFASIDRTLLDDFQADDDWSLTCFEWRHVWNGGSGAGFGTDLSIDFKQDSGGTPNGALVGTANVTSYSDVETGNVYFSRPEVISTVGFDPIAVTPGTYWFDATICGDDNNFWLIDAGSILLSECWLDYVDLAYYGPGAGLFGTPADLSWNLQGRAGSGGGGGCCDGVPCLWDNGLHDGVNGYSNGTPTCWSAALDRTILDDFELKADAGLTCFQMYSVWNLGAGAGFGSSIEISFREDSAGTPNGAALGTANVTCYSDTETGNVFFSRPEVCSQVSFDPISASAGKNWFEAAICGDDNNFWLTAAVQCNECWVDYVDLGVYGPGSTVFGAPSDVSWKLYGEEEDPPPPREICKIYNNGKTDGSNGYSCLLDPCAMLGINRTVLDDFAVPKGKEWAVNSLCWTSIWNTLQPGVGTGADILFRQDAAGTPGADFTGVLPLTSYTEVATGNVFFSRPEAAHTAEFDCIGLTEGKYWFEAAPCGPANENNFWLIRADVTCSECWINYSDLGYGPGSAIFGVPADLNFQLGAKTIGTKYCQALPNSTGGVASITAVGSTTVSGGGNNLTLSMCGIPPGETGYPLNSMNQGNLPVSNGILCIGDGKGRHVDQVGSADSCGMYTACIDLTALPRSKGGPVAVMAGDTWYFTFWHRDGSRSNFTNGVCILFD